jgi:hypothetical protein
VARKTRILGQSTRLRGIPGRFICDGRIGAANRDKLDGAKHDERDGSTHYQRLYPMCTQVIYHFSLHFQRSDHRHKLERLN